MRWALPDRVFFACGACHVLAHAFLERHGDHDTQVLWLKPATGFTGNHIVVGKAFWIFDYHGYSDRESFLSHTVKKARRCWPGWNATLIPLPRDVPEARSRLFTASGCGNPTSSSLTHFPALTVTWHGFATDRIAVTPAGEEAMAFRWMLPSTAAQRHHAGASRTHAGDPRAGRMDGVAGRGWQPDRRTDASGRELRAASLAHVARGPFGAERRGGLARAGGRPCCPTGSTNAWPLAWFPGLC